MTVGGKLQDCRSLMLVLGILVCAPPFAAPALAETGDLDAIGIFETLCLKATPTARDQLLAAHATELPPGKAKPLLAPHTGHVFRIKGVAGYLVSVTDKGVCSLFSSISKGEHLKKLLLDRFKIKYYHSGKRKGEAEEMFLLVYPENRRSMLLLRWLNNTPDALGTHIYSVPASILPEVPADDEWPR